MRENRKYGSVRGGDIHHRILAEKLGFLCKRHHLQCAGTPCTGCRAMAAYDPLARPDAEDGGGSDSWEDCWPASVGRRKARENSL